MSVFRDFPDMPPVWALGTLCAQWVLSSVLPILRISLPSIGWILIAVGLGLAVWSALWFWRKRTAIEPRHTPTALIVEGPYRLNRNPIYTGMAICLVGTGLILGALSALLLVPVFLWIITRRFVIGEEAALRTAFGAVADRYIADSRRW